MISYFFIIGYLSGEIHFIYALEALTDVSLLDSRKEVEIYMLQQTEHTLTNPSCMKTNPPLSVTLTLCTCQALTWMT